MSKVTRINRPTPNAKIPMYVYRLVFEVSFNNRVMRGAEEIRTPMPLEYLGQFQMLENMLASRMKATDTQGHAVIGGPQATALITSWAMLRTDVVDRAEFEEALAKNGQKLEVSAEPGQQGEEQPAETQEEGSPSEQGDDAGPDKAA